MHEEIYRINQSSETRDIIGFQICGTTFPDKGYRIERPDSTIACIEYVESGSGVVHIGGKTFKPKGGDSYFLITGKDQLYYSDPKDPWKKHFVNLSGDLLLGLVKGYHLEEVSHFEGLDIKDQLFRIIDIAKSGMSDRTPELISIVNEIFLKMYTHLHGGTEGIAENIKSILDRQITERYSLSELCLEVSLSESQIIRTFKRTYGQTPYRYLLDRKIDYGKRLLENTRLTVKEIAATLAFADEYYFSNVFKSKVGLSPLAYRKTIGKREGQ